MSRTRQELRDEALANLRIIQQADTSATRTRDELVSEALNVLGVVQKTPTVSAGTRTRVDLIGQVLFNLGALGEGNTVPSADATVAVIAAANSVARMLDARRVVTIADTNAIDNAYFLPFASIVTEAMKEQYGIDADTTEAAGLVADAKQAELDLKIMTRSAMADAKLPSLIGELNARGVCTVTDLAAIPGAWFPSLAVVLANSVKGYFEWLDAGVITRVAGEAQIAERTLKNLTRTYLVERNIDSIISELAAREIVYLVDDSAIPEEWFPHLAWIVADRCKGKFELDAEVIQMAAAEGVNAIATLREQTRGRPSYNTLRTVYM